MNDELVYPWYDLLDNYRNMCLLLVIYNIRTVHMQFVFAQMNKNLEVNIVKFNNTPCKSRGFAFASSLIFSPLLCTLWRCLNLVLCWVMIRNRIEM